MSYNKKAHLLASSTAENGAFVDNFKTTFPTMETVCFEKDLLTGKILSHLQPENKVHIQQACARMADEKHQSRFVHLSVQQPFTDHAGTEVKEMYC